MRSYTIGKLAKAANVGVETIRYYERRGLIAQPPHHSHGYRRYPEATLQRIRFIKNNQALGLTLKEIGETLNLLDSRELNCGDVANMIDLKISEIDSKIEKLKQFKRSLKRLANSVGNCGAKEKMEFLSEIMSNEG